MKRLTAKVLTAQVNRQHRINWYVRLEVCLVCLFVSDIAPLYGFVRVWCRVRLVPERSLRRCSVSCRTNYKTRTIVRYYTVFRLSFQWEQHYSKHARCFPSAVIICDMWHEKLSRLLNNAVHSINCLGKLCMEDSRQWTGRQSRTNRTHLVSNRSICFCLWSSIPVFLSIIWLSTSYTCVLYLMFFTHFDTCFCMWFC